jgi:ABC-2 type transport system permease protein
MFYPLMVLVALLAFSGGLIGEEEDSGTLDLVLARPIRRWRFMLEKVLALFVFTWIVLTAILVGILLGVVLGQQSINLGNTALVLVNMGALALLFGALTLMLHGFGLGRGGAIGIGGGLAAITYLLHGLAPVVSLPQITQRLSPWYYYDGGATLVEGQNWGHLLILVGVMLLFLSLAMIGFERRDVDV